MVLMVLMMTGSQQLQEVQIWPAQMTMMMLLTLWLLVLAAAAAGAVLAAAQQP